jgi:2'-5' RNA ligase
VDEGAAQDLHDALAEISAPGFDLELNGLGTFGGRQAHTLYAAVERTPALVHLRDKVESACVRSGLAPEPRKFTPHVTLARLKDAPTGRVQEFITRFSPFHAGPVAVDGFVLFRSHLSRNGAEYEAVAEYGLS